MSWETFTLVVVLNLLVRFLTVLLMAVKVVQIIYSACLSFAMAFSFGEKNVNKYDAVSHSHCTHWLRKLQWHHICNRLICVLRELNFTDTQIVNTCINSTCWMPLVYCSLQSAVHVCACSGRHRELNEWINEIVCRVPGYQAFAKRSKVSRASLLPHVQSK